MRWIAILILMLIATQSASAGEIIGLNGLVFDTSRGGSNFAWQIEYDEQLAEYLEASFTYLNEGHLKGHHRDGHGIQLRARKDFLGRRLSLSAGAGPYLYYDTIQPTAVNMEIDRHGLALISSIAATWRFDNRLLLRLNLNSVTTPNSIDTLTALVGIGYQLDPPITQGKSTGPAVHTPQTSLNELTLFIGESNVFNEGDSHSFATAVEYRRRLFRYLEWSASFLYETDSDLIRRKGVITQLWASKSFYSDKLSLGVGAGPYLAFDSTSSIDQGGKDIYVLPVVTMTGCYRFLPHWGARFSWNRVITDYDRDSDVWMLGLSYLF